MAKLNPIISMMLPISPKKYMGLLPTKIPGAGPHEEGARVPRAAVRLVRRCRGWHRRVEGVSLE